VTTGTAVHLRVTVTDTWDTVAVDAGPDTSVADVKRQALRGATGRPVVSGEYVVKFRGGLVLDERKTVGDLAIPDGAALIVLPSRRHPIR
jgi:hypothetical protein